MPPSLAWKSGQQAELWRLLYPPSVMELSLGWVVNCQVYGIAACMSFTGKEKFSVQLQAAMWPLEQLCQCLIELVATMNNRKWFLLIQESNKSKWLIQIMLIQMMSVWDTSLWETWPQILCVENWVSNSWYQHIVSCSSTRGTATIPIAFVCIELQKTLSPPHCAIALGTAGDTVTRKGCLISAA